MSKPLDFKSLTVLAKFAANSNNANTCFSFNDEKYSCEQVNETLRRELNKYALDYNTFQENKYKIFKLMEEVIQDVLPRKVLDQYGDFAEIKQFNQGDKAVFTQKITSAAKRRAKQFITKVGLAGVYEVFKLDGKSYEIPTTAFGGAAQIGFEEFLDKRFDMADLVDIMLEGLDEAIYIEIEKALKGAVENLQTANKTTQTGFVETAMDNLLQIADSYGTGKSTIYCTFEFAAKMVPAEGWVSDSMKEQRWNNGYLANYKGHKVIVLNQSFEDETNSKKVIDPAYAWIIPGSSEKPVKIAFEGQTIVKDWENRDLSREIQVYKKVGVGAIINNDICVYIDSSLKV